MKTKRIIALLMAGAMAVSMAGCGNSENGKTNQDTTADAADNNAGSDDATQDDAEADGEWDEVPAEVTWYMWNVGGTVTPEGVDAVEEKLNEITLKKINVKVDLEILEMGTYLTQMAMEVGAGSKIDLISTFPAAAGSYSQMVAKNQLMPLNDLLEEYAPELLETVPQEYLKATQKDGVTYAIPVYNDQRNDYYWECRTSVLDELGIDPDSIKDVNDITEVFAKVHEARPDLKCISTAGQNLVGNGLLWTGDIYDTLGTNLAAVMVDDDATKVVCALETDEFKESVKILNEWYAAGYIDKNAPIREDDPISDKSVFSFCLSGNPSRVLATDQAAGEPLTKVKIGEGCISTGVATILTMAIPVSATEPEGAAKLLNLCYTDEEVKTLISYGLEGTDYTTNDDGTITKSENAAYNPNTSVIFGNQFLLPLTAEEAAIGIDNTDVDSSSWNYSPLYGFSVDLSKVSTVDTQLQNVYGEFNATITCGFGSDDDYQAYIDKLYTAGLQDYLDELQSQLDAYLAQ